MENEVIYKPAIVKLRHGYQKKHYNTKEGRVNHGRLSRPVHLPCVVVVVECLHQHGRTFAVWAERERGVGSDFGPQCIENFAKDLPDARKREKKNVRA